MGIFVRLLLREGSTPAMKAGFNAARLLPEQFSARYQFAENFTQSPGRLGGRLADSTSKSSGSPIARAQPLRILLSK
jgi:hypothetical protein